MGISLEELNHDVLIYVFTVLSIPEILLFRQVSRRLYLVSEQHAVWSTVCTNQILRNGIPFPKRSLTSFSAKDLERHTLRAYRLGLNWRSPTATLRPVATSQKKLGSVEQVKFLYRHERSWIVTVSRGIWWTLCIRDCDTLQIVAQWSPQKALFNGIAVNTDDESDAAVAISVHRDDRMVVEILAISDDDAHGMTIESQRTLHTSSRPIALNGDFVSLCDHESETVILNWRTEEQALLKSPNTWQDKPLHVVFTHGNVIVMRARSICIFEEPRMVLPGDDLDVILPHISKSFGWVDGVSPVSGQSAPFSPVGTSQPPLSLLVRKKGDNPWRPSDQFQLMTLSTDLDRTLPHAPHDTPLVEHESVSFPFSLVASLSSHHWRPLSCSDMVLGPCGTAVWVHPADWAIAGLIIDDDPVESTFGGMLHETLVVALFPGALNPGSSEAQIKVALENHGEGWSCLDYDETRGLIALGSSSGKVELYRL